MIDPPPATPTRSAPQTELEIPPSRRPRHIAVIMDGNGRWALERQRSRIEGHRAGAQTVREVVTECGRLGVEALTMYSFSSENWKRPTAEVNALMELCLDYLVRQRQELLENNVRFRQIGRRAELPRSVQTEIEETESATRDATGLTLVLALNYGARTEITDATRAIAAAVQAGRMSVEDIDESTIARHLYTAGLPDPDLLIRTAGEYRVSNYLLWQISYAEIHVTDVYWPEFTRAHLHAAIRDFAGRDRRFGAVTVSD